MTTDKGQMWVAGLEYDGSGFRGWQAQQPGVRTVQEVLTAALSRVADHPLEAVCAGRTDAGVHALGQVVHFQSPAPRPPRAWLLGCNSALPDDVNLRWVEPVDDDFHARYSAHSRSYRYVFWNRPARTALGRQRACWVYHPLDAAAMHRAAQALIGEHDFSAYRAVACQSPTPMRFVEAISVQREGDLVVMDIRANAFLHHMVRNIAGVLMAVGKGDAEESWPADVLVGRDRTRGGVTAPAEGLYFHGVRYPDFPAIDRLSKPSHEPMLPGPAIPGQ
ncbi:tRNA pseudouridine(38-40) synthase TruA [Gammaproteobacteria bacterium AB-CW1]|uniref:tRNA pseudouridine synthase A n=1 Tax=Natronospira elongata TaxID=3110268 RepID=A0AAP6JCR7_9GAMM|nr:tRNA pseudouridine(38-40) synthase TruA [Gammaproteobacteria bacterium AB-CW1]